MSLFDVIKYGDTNLGDQHALSKLPGELLTLYWDKSRAGFAGYDICWILSYWYRHDKPLQLARFIETLKEYDEPI